MRVVAGTAKGRKLVAPKGDTTRPTSDHVREAIFNSLAAHISLDGATVLDVFAGTGALGIEALSRGAAHATFVERDRHALAALRRNLDATGLASRATVLAADATTATLPPVDVAFADPPYTFAGWDGLLARITAELVAAESDRPIDPTGRWRAVRSKRYGGTVVSLFLLSD